MQPTTCFDLIPGKPPVAVGEPAFTDSWRDAGPAPEADEGTIRNAERMQTFGAAITPLL